MKKLPLIASASAVALIALAAWSPLLFAGNTGSVSATSEGRDRAAASGDATPKSGPNKDQAGDQTADQAAPFSTQAEVIDTTESDKAGNWFIADAIVSESAGAELQQTEPEGSTQHRYAPFDAEAALSALIAPGARSNTAPGERVVFEEQTQLEVKLFDGNVAKIRVDEVAVTRPLESSDAPLVEVLGTRLDGGEERSASFAFVAGSDGAYSLRGQIEEDGEDVTAIQQASNDIYRIDQLDVASLGLPDESDDAIPASDEVEEAVAASEEVEEAIAASEEVEEAEEAIAAPEEAEDTITASEEAEDPAAASAPPVADAAVASASDTTIYNLDIIVGYVNGTGGTIVSEIGSQIAQTNQALQRSQVNARLVLVETRALNVSQSPSMRNDLELMRSGTGSYQELRNRRDYLGADLVALIVPNSASGSCGIAYLPSPQGSPSFALSVTARQCFANLTLMHEIGHNLGASHNHEALTGPAYPFSYSAGHAVPGKARDIMSYACVNAACPRVPQYSNPNLTFLGFPGVASGVAGRSDIARSFNQMAPIIANYRARPQPLTQAIAIISGSVIVGSTLTANPGAWGPAPVTLTYQWLRNGQPIAGATQAKYTLQPADAVQEIRVKVTGAKAGYFTASVNSAGVKAVGVLTPKVPTIAGAPEVGKTLTATPGAWAPAPVTFSYQWHVDGVSIPGATAATYVPKAQDLEKTITVTVTGKKTGYSSAATTSAGTLILRSLTGVTPTVTGAPIAGLTLTGNVGVWGPEPVAVTYQWLRNGQPIAGATESTFLLRAEDVGQEIRLQVTGALPGYATQTRSSLPTTLKAQLPTGNYESFVVKDGVARATGWAVDPDAFGAVDIHAYQGGPYGRGKWAGSFSTGSTRPDVQRAFPNHGTQNGFEIVMPPTGGGGQLCLYAIDKQGKGNTFLGCRTLATAGPPIGNFESAVGIPGGANITGWSLDPDVTAPIPVHIYVDSRRVGAYSANQTRPDVARVYPKFGPDHGFAVALSGLAPGNHNVCVYAIDQFGSSNTLLGCRQVRTPAAELPFGQFDALQKMTDGTIVGHGWAIEKNLATPVPIHVYKNGKWLQTLSADTSRPDVGAVYPGAGSNRGFNFTANGPGQYCVYAISSTAGAPNPLLGCRTI